MTKGIWIITHGSVNPEWIDNIDNTISKVKSNYPLVTSFLEKAEGRTIIDGIKSLAELKLTEVLVVPLFVSSGSNHIYEIKEILSNYNKQFNFIFSPAIDDHHYVVKHIIEHAAKLSLNPKKEILFLIGHGSNEAKGQGTWAAMLNSIADQLKSITEYAEIKYATFLPGTIKQELAKIDRDLTALVIPLFLSKGYYTGIKIPAEIKDYKAEYTDKTYIDGDWIPNWVESQIDEYYNLDKRETKEK